MSRLPSRSQPGARPRLWLDGHDYCARVLGDFDWTDADAVVTRLAQCQRLLASDGLGLDVTRLLPAWVRAHPRLRQAMGEKPRTGYALKVLLADPRLQHHVNAVLQGLAATLPEVSLCLTMPSPTHAIGIAASAVNPSLSSSPDGDQIEGAARYLATFLNGVLGPTIEVVLLVEADDEVGVDAERLARYQHLTDVVRDHQWTFALLPSSQHRPEAPPDGWTLAVHETLPLPNAVHQPPDAVGCDEGLTDSCPIRFIRIPADTAPDAVMATLQRLRAA